MTSLSTWEQSAIYDPTNPNQRTYVYYTGIPGRYSSFYYNRVPTTAKLQGVFDSMPDWTTALLVGLLGAGLGFFGARAYKAKSVTKAFQFSGARRRR